MTKMLDLIESYLDQRGERACRIDGSIPWQARARGGRGATQRGARAV